jgi:hypothetical protein
MQPPCSQITILHAWTSTVACSSTFADFFITALISPLLGYVVFHWLLILPNSSFPNCELFSQTPQLGHVRPQTLRQTQRDALHVHNS